MNYFAWTMLITAVLGMVVAEKARRGPRRVLGLRVMMRREIDFHPGFAEEQIDRALKSADEFVHRGIRPLLFLVPALLTLITTLWIATTVFPLDVWTGQRWSMLPALWAVVLGPFLVVAWVTARITKRQLTREFRRRLPG